MEASGGERITKYTKQAIDAMLIACSFDSSVAPQKLQERLNVSDARITKIAIKL